MIGIKYSKTVNEDDSVRFNCSVSLTGRYK